MSAQLGAGVRVYIGWTPKEKRLGCHSGEGLCCTGTVLKGPFAPFELPPGLSFEKTKSGVIPAFEGPWWVVRTDGGFIGGYCESILHPIDDGDPATVEHDETVTA